MNDYPRFYITLAIGRTSQVLLYILKSSIAGIYEDYFILHEEAFIFPYWYMITSPQLVGNTTFISLSKNVNKDNQSIPIYQKYIPILLFLFLGRQPCAD